MVICELPPQKLIDLHERGQLKYYAIKVLLNIVRNKKSNFNKYMVPNTAYIEDSGEQDDKGEDVDYKGITKRLHWYEEGIFNIYKDCRNIAKMSVELGIPYSSLIRTINSVKKKIKKQIK